MKNFWRILRYAKPYRTQITFLVIFNVLTVIFSVFSLMMLLPVMQFILENTSSQVISPPEWTGIGNIGKWVEGHKNYYLALSLNEHGKWPVFRFVLAIGAFAFIIKNIARYLAAIFMTYLRNGIERDIKTDLHDKIISLPMQVVSDVRKGDLLTRLSTDTFEVQRAILSSIQRVVQDPLMILFTLGVMIVLSPQLTVFALIFIPVVAFVISAIGNSLKKSSTQLRSESARLLSYLEEHINGLSMIKSYVAENVAQARFNISNSRLFRLSNKMMYRNELASPASETLGSLVIIGVMGFGGYLIINKGSLTAEAFITYIALFYSIIAPLKNLGKASANIKVGEASALRIFEVLDYENPLADKPDASSISGFNESIEFKNVSFAYGQEYVVKNFNLRIPKGKTVALVGQSGSGKSTVANLINRFYDVSEGAILVDGVDIRDVQKHSLRSLIGLISQEAILFNGSIEENIQFGVSAVNSEQVRKAAKLANALEFIEQFPEGFDYNIGDQGRKLSGGQRQRLTIARAILKNPPIMVLDEATSALDSESEKLVQDAITQIMKGRTALIIAHRLSTIQYADEIIVMKNGEIIERGNHSTLVDLQGEYYNLVQLQAI